MPKFLARTIIQLRIREEVEADTEEQAWEKLWKKYEVATIMAYDTSIYDEGTMTLVAE